MCKTLNETLCSHFFVETIKEMFFFLAVDIIQSLSLSFAVLIDL